MELKFTPPRVSTITSICSAYNEINESTKINIFKLARNIKKYYGNIIKYIKFSDTFIYNINNEDELIYGGSYNIINPWYKKKITFTTEKLTLNDGSPVSITNIDDKSKNRVRVEFMHGEKYKKKKKTKNSRVKKKSDFGNSFTIEIFVKIGDEIKVSNCKISTNGKIQITGCTSRQYIDLTVKKLNILFTRIHGITKFNINDVYLCGKIPSHIKNEFSINNDKFSDLLSSTSNKIKTTYTNHKNIFSESPNVNFCYIALMMSHFSVMKPENIRINQLNLYKLLKKLNNENIFVIYENLLTKELKLDYTLPNNTTLTYLIFSSCRVNMTNARSMKDVVDGYNFLKNFITKHISDIILIDTVNEAISLIERRGEYPQLSKKWFEIRKRCITASEVNSIILKYPPYKPYEQYISEKVLDLNNIPRGDKFKGNAATRHGQMFEPITRKIYVIKSNNSKLRHYNCYAYETGFYTHKLNKFIGASPDGILLKYKKTVTMKPDIRMLRKKQNSILDSCLIEIKCLSRFVHVTDLKVNKPTYYCQIQQQLYVTGLKYCVFINAKFTKYNKLPTHSEYVGVFGIGYDSQYNEIYVYPDGYLYKNYSIYEIMAKIKNLGCKQYKLVYWSLDKFEHMEIDYDKFWYENNIPMIKHAYKKIISGDPSSYTIQI